MRWIFRLITLVIVMAACAVGLVFLLPAEKIGELASSQLERATGRKLTLSGAFKPTVYPILGVKTGPLTISNAPWASEPYMVSAQGALVGVGLEALIGGAIEVKQLILDTPVINLERNAQGVANWDLSGTNSSETSSTASSSNTPITLEEGSITKGVIRYKDATAGQNTTLSAINVDFALPKSGSVRADGSAIWDGKKASIAGSVASLEKLLSGHITNAVGSVGVGALKASFDGQAMMPANGAPLISGNYTFDIPNIGQVTKLTGASLPAEFSDIKTITGSGNVQMSEAGLSLIGKSKLTLNGLPLTTDFEIAGPENWAETLRVDANVDVIGQDAFTFNWAGLVNGTTFNADGNAKFAASDLPKTLKAMGQDIGFPTGTGKTAMAQGTVRIRDGKNGMSGATFALDNNTYKGSATMTLDNGPYVVADLVAGALDFSAFTADDGSSDAGASETGWSKEPIRITGLDALDADIKLRASSVELGITKLGKTDINASLKKGTLRLKLNDVRAYSGAMSGVVSFTGGSKSVSFSSDIKASSVQLEQLLGGLLDIDRVTGSGNTTLKMSGTGGSLYQIMHSLTGNGSVKVDQGSFKGIDLASMLQNLQSAFGGFEGATEFTSMTGTFNTKKGVLQNIDMEMVAPFFKATGTGKIDLASQAMSYVVSPSSLSKDAKYSVPVSISGPWSNLKFRPDLEDLVDLLTKGKLAEEKKRLKAKAKAEEAKLKAKAKAELAKKLKLDEAQAKALLNKKKAKAAAQALAKKKAEEKLKKEAGKALLKLFE